MALQFHIVTGGTTPIYRQIVDQVRREVALGMLAAGQPLPSVRALAEQLVVNPNTVARAYGELVRDGLVEARQGRGFFVVDRRQVYSDAERARRLGVALDALLSEVLVLDFKADELRAALDERLAQFLPPGRRKRGQTDG